MAPLQLMAVELDRDLAALQRPNLKSSADRAVGDRLVPPASELCGRQNDAPHPERCRALEPAAGHYRGTAPEGDHAEDAVRLGLLERTQRPGPNGVFGVLARLAAAAVARVPPTFLNVYSNPLKSQGWVLRGGEP